MCRSAVLGFTGKTSGIDKITLSSGRGLFKVPFIVEIYVGILSLVDWICRIVVILVTTQRLFLPLFHVKHIRNCGRCPFVHTGALFKCLEQISST